MSLFTLNNSVIPCPTKSQNGGCTRNWFQSITAKAAIIYNTMIINKLNYYHCTD